MKQQQSQPKPTMKFEGPFAAYRDAGSRFIAAAKQMRGIDPCASLHRSSPLFEAWCRTLTSAFGTLPWEFQECHHGRTETVTVPCDDPSLFTSLLAAVIDEHRQRGAAIGLSAMPKPVRDPRKAEIDATVASVIEEVDGICYRERIGRNTPERRAVLIEVLASRYPIGLEIVANAQPPRFQEAAE